MMKQEKQIVEHCGANKAKTAKAFSFVYGRGWKSHKSIKSARRATDKEVRAFVRCYGGGEPQNIVRGPLSAAAIAELG